MATAVARCYADRFFAAVARRRMRLPTTLSPLTGQPSKQSAGGLSPEIASEVLFFFRRCVEDLSQRIGGPDAETRAFQIIATLEGGMMLARAYQDTDAFDQAVAGLV
jgi:TetR/AcrR family transcriptional repressor of nem operon